MDIKLKSSNKLKAQKIILFILTILFFTGFIMSILDIAVSTGGYVGLPVENNFLDGEGFNNEIQEKIDLLNSYVYMYKSEENVRNGGTLDHPSSEYQHKKRMLYEQYEQEILEKNGGIYIEFNEEMERKFEEDNQVRLERLKEDIVEKELKRFEDLERQIEEIDGKEFVFYVTDGSTTISNTEAVEKKEFEKYPVSILVDRDGFDFNGEVKSSSIYNSAFYRLKDELIESVRYSENENEFYIAWTNSYVDRMSKEWSKILEKSTRLWIHLAIAGLGLLISFIGTVFLAGKSDEPEKGVKMFWIDRMWTDFTLTICGGIMLVWIGIAANSIDYGYYSNKINVDIWGNNFIIFLTVLMSTLGLYLFLSLVRHIKNKTILSHSLVGKIVGAVFGFLKEVHDSSSTSKKVGLALALYPMVVAATFVIFPITIGVVIFFAIKKVKEFEAIKEGVKKIKNGDLDYQIQIDKRGEFKNLAEDINEISGGLKKAVDNELKSERHRSELITNVSHDIRTPLTSIITYVDLLKHEEDHEEKEKYIEVLESKSKRLKQLIDNLFEASKYSSGDVPVESSKIDIVSLLNQGLGELNDEIENKKLDFITSFESEEMLVIADGELLWRAIENLLSNILKYALKGSRVYIDIFQEDNHVLLIMKNISAYELNISEEELMRRFARGDDSRNSDGSGLGLSIATSLIELQKGEFKIDIDGDLFKTSIKLPKY